MQENDTLIAADGSVGEENGQPIRRLLETATLAGGCFWCVEAVVQMLRGVVRVESGFSGGHVPNATYREVCAGTTGHAEVVQVAFDPQILSYTDLLRVFFTAHDPTTLNRQGADVGTQYRSAVFYHSPEQRAIALDVIRQISSEAWYSSPIVTQLAPFDEFVRAEPHHQNYYQANAQSRYCQIVIAPKLAKIRKAFLAQLRS